MFAGNRQKGKRVSAAALDPPFRKMRAFRGMHSLTLYAPRVRAFILGSTVTAAASLTSLSASAQSAAQPGAQDAQDQVVSQIRADAQAERESRTSHAWYVLAADIPSALALDAGYLLSAASNGDTGSSALILGGFSVYTLAAPILHWVDGSIWQGFASLGLHVVGELSALGAESGLLCGNTKPCGFSVPGPLVGLLIFAIPTTIDALFLSDKRVEHEWRAKTAWVPTLQVKPNGAVAGLGKAF
jgi:hypothetical protein